MKQKAWRCATCAINNICCCMRIGMRARYAASAYNGVNIIARARASIFLSWRCTSRAPRAHSISVRLPFSCRSHRTIARAHGSWHMYMVGKKLYLSCLPLPSRVLREQSPASRMYANSHCLAFLIAPSPVGYNVMYVYSAHNAFNAAATRAHKICIFHMYAHAWLVYMPAYLFLLSSHRRASLSPLGSAGSRGFR